MSQVVTAKGQMYDWISHQWSPGRGCSFQCLYCYVKNFGGNPSTFRLEYPPPALGKYRSIFIGHMNDMFSEAVSDSDIQKVIDHCKKFPLNQYVFQSKNPERILDFELPEHSLVGTTIETDDGPLLQHYSSAPPPADRAMALSRIKGTTFLTIEPIMKFDLVELLLLIEIASPSFVNIGADSKNNNLPEPSWVEVQALIIGIENLGITVKQKTNLDRLKNK